MPEEKQDDTPGEDEGEGDLGGAPVFELDGEERESESGQDVEATDDKTQEPPEKKGDQRQEGKRAVEFVGGEAAHGLVGVKDQAQGVGAKPIAKREEKEAFGSFDHISP